MQSDHDYHTMYVCMYVCMYVRTYVRTYVCMYACMYVCMQLCMYVYRSAVLGVLLYGAETWAHTQELVCKLYQFH